MSFEFPHTVGHTHARARIVRAIESGRVPHALLIQGVEGSGMFALALDVALLLLCQQESRPCMTCPECRKVMANAHPDLQVYHPFPSPDALKMKEEEYWEYMRTEISGLIRDPFQRLSFPKESRLSIGTMRQLQQNLEAGSGPGKQRVVIICQADRMGEEAANSFLKTLEEPLPGVLFMLITARPFMILPTIQSRCQSFRLGQIQEEELRAHLKSSRPDCSDKDLLLAGKLANGSITRASELLGGELDEAREFADAWIRGAERGNVEDAIELATQLTASKNLESVKRMLEIVLIRLREACILRDEKGSSLRLTPERAEHYLQIAKRILADLGSNVIPNALLFTGMRELQRSRT